ncbi:hypothetical protein [Roseibacillus persicicus]|uniref:hypothetical protein n=1 Tax=Roseibacillus persicicus TaxID=454148 RepID=UPI00280CA2DF|nr:hypothetical protein [Roseibacillus persicicus]MDQ8190702.1 hypothetical protein [Roseibacillus persicicus]
MRTTEILRDGLAYPFRENGRMILIWGAILGVASDLASILPVIGLIAWLVLAGFFCSTFFEIMVSSASGSDDCPGFPNLSDLLEDLILPFIKVVAVALFSFAPALIFAFTADGGAATYVLLMALVGVGIVYFPMAILGVGILGTFRALSPHIVVPSIFKAGGLYWAIVGILFAVYVLQSFLLALLGEIFIVGALVAAFVSMLALMINGRLLGLLYRNKEDELEWI